MMTCERALEAAVLREAGEADPGAVRELEAHLRLCAACREEARGMRAAIEAARSVQAPDPGADYWDGFDARLRARTMRAGPRRAPESRGRMAMVAAAAGLLVAATVGVTAWFRAPVRGGHLAAGRAPVVSGGGAATAAPGSGKAESRLDQALRMSLQSGDGDHFEAVLDEVAPAAPLEGGWELEDPGRPPAETPGTC